MANLRELRQKRTKLGADARALMEGAQEASRDMTAEEETEFDRLLGERDKIDKQIEREEKLREGDGHDPTVRDEPPPQGREDSQNGGDVAARAWRSYLLGGRQALDAEQARALNMGNDPEGGFLVAPQRFVTDLIQEVDDMVAIRRLATVQQLSQAESLGVPALDTDLNDAEWTSEIGTGSQDDSLRFGKRELNPHPLAKRVKLSRTLLRRAAMDPEAIVRQRMSYKFGVTEEKAYMTGDGNQKPLGLFTASSDGISTSRDVDVTTDGTNVASGAADDLIDAKYMLKAAYHRRARWLFHRNAIRDIRKLKDDQGQYLWQPGLAADRPDTILDLPFTLSEFTPSDFSDNSYIGLLGDFSFYWIADALSMEVQRLVELYAESNQVGFIGRLETDGMPVLEEPFVRLQSNDTSS